MTLNTAKCAWWSFDDSYLSALKTLLIVEWQNRDSQVPTQEGTEPGQDYWGISASTRYHLQSGTQDHQKAAIRVVPVRNIRHDDPVHGQRPSASPQSMQMTDIPLARADLHPLGAVKPALQDT